MDAFAFRFNRRIFLCCLLTLALLAAMLASTYHFRLEGLVWHLWYTHFQKNSPSQSLDINGYKVALDGITIGGLEAGVSDLTYNLETNTLFTVLDKEPLLVELSLDGKVLRKIQVDGVGDMEGITHIEGNRYVIADEHDLRLILIQLEDGIDRIDASKAPQISVGIDASGNKNFEGVSWDERNKRLLVVKEKDPLRILNIEGFVNAEPTNSDLRISHVVQSESPMKLRDFSSVSYHDPTGHSVLLSDESRLAVEYSIEGQPVSVLALWQGFHGLKNNVPQAEGIAIGPDQHIYVVSEPNLFYMFKPEAS